jgi:cellulose synthase/poly-beta-1,6-N-acetylglucosamine synthase-like glycosyltransferase
MKKIGISVAICSHNSEKIIKDTLLHLSRQKTSPNRKWEILLINNNSTDSTADIVKDLMRTNIILRQKIRIIQEKRLGIANARLKALKQSKYEVISFIDDDNWVSPNWIEQVSKLMETNPTVAVCGGHNKPPKLKNKPYWFERYQECYAIGKQSEKSGDVTKQRGFVWGAGMSVRKKAWEEISKKGFKFFLTGRVGNIRGAGEDSELSFALRLAGWRIWYDSKLTLVHAIDSDRITWQELRKMFRGFGVGRAGHDPYFFAEKPKKFNQHWYVQVFIVLFDIIKEIHILLKSHFVEMEGDNRVLRMEHKLGHLYFLLMKRSEFDRRTQHLRLM